MKRRRVLWLAAAASVVIIAACVFLPLLFYVGGPHDSTICLSHVKQCGESNRAYSEDFDGVLPLAGTWMDVTAKYRRSTPIYSRKDDVLRCPKVDEGFGYAANLWTAARSPGDSHLPLIFESRDLSRNATRTIYSLPEVSRHGRGVAVYFGDGHVEAKSKTLILARALWKQGPHR